MCKAWLVCVLKMIDYNIQKHYEIVSYFVNVVVISPYTANVENMVSY